MIRFDLLNALGWKQPTTPNTGPSSVVPLSSSLCCFYFRNVVTHAALKIR